MMMLLTSKTLRRSTAAAVLTLLVACPPGDGDGTDDPTATSGAGTTGDPTEGGSATAAEIPAQCADPTPILQAGVEGSVPSGFVGCANGQVHRVEQVTCQVPIAPGNCNIVDDENSSCEVDADCGSNGACVLMQAGPVGNYCGCASGCATDADCPASTICACSGVAGGSRCIYANCVTDADCPDGLCRLAQDSSACDGGLRLACTGPADTCSFDDQCEGSQNICYPSPDLWQCVHVEGCV